MYKRCTLTIPSTSIGSFSYSNHFKEKQSQLSNFSSGESEPFLSFISEFHFQTPLLLQTELVPQCSAREAVLLMYITAPLLSCSLCTRYFVLGFNLQLHTNRASPMSCQLRFIGLSSKAVFKFRDLWGKKRKKVLVWGFFYFFSFLFSIYIECSINTEFQLCFHHSSVYL